MAASDVDFEALLRRTGRTGSILSGVGALLALTAFGWFSWQLVTTTKKLTATRGDLAEVERQVAAKKEERAKLEAQLTQLKQVAAEKDLALKRERNTQQELLDAIGADAKSPPKALGGLAAKLDEVAREEERQSADAPHDPHEQAHIRWQMGRAASLRRQDDVAKRHFNEALRYDPGYAAAYNSLGKLEANDDTPASNARAEQLYKEALTRQPDYVPALSNLALLELHRGRKDQARGYAEEILKLRPEHPTATHILQQTQPR